jgi:aspartate oxidase
MIKNRKNRGSNTQNTMNNGNEAKNKTHEVIIVGCGLSAMVTAARLVELGFKNIGIYASGYGATPFIAAINFVLPENSYGDTWQQYCKDMLNNGFRPGNPQLVEEMTRNTVKGYELLRRWGVSFARNDDGSIKLRHLSGHTYPRSLCCTTQLIGRMIIGKMIKRLKKDGLAIHKGCECVRLLEKGNRIYGITIRKKDQTLENVYSSIVVAAWGGLGHLFGQSTYPRDIKGNTLAIAAEAGVDFVDLEFYEFEPLVVLSPPAAVGEPCPTAMLGEGAYLLNATGQRFMLEVRPQGEAGTSKAVLNQQIWKQVAAGKGSENGGVWADLRHIDREVLKAYPWFYKHLMKAGVDPCSNLIEIGPVHHSLSGGIKVDFDYQSKIRGLYAVGEACGGIHGANRLGGNAASQAVLSGLRCAEAISRSKIDTQIEEFPVYYPKNKDIFTKYVPGARDLAAKVLGIHVNSQDLKAAEISLENQCSKEELKKDEEAYQILLSILLMVKAATTKEENTREIPSIPGV